MQKVIKINENDIGKMVTEALSELNYQTIKRAKDAGPYAADHNSGVWQFSEIADAVRTIRDALNFYTQSGFNYGGIKGIENNPQYQAACKGVDAIEKFFTRKANQQLNFANRFDDYRSEYEKEFETKALEMFPELKDTSNPLQKIDPHRMTDEMYDQIVSQLSPNAKEYIENEGW